MLVINFCFFFVRGPFFETNTHYDQNKTNVFLFFRVARKRKNPEVDLSLRTHNAENERKIKRSRIKLMKYTFTNFSEQKHKKK